MVSFKDDRTHPTEIFMHTTICYELFKNTTVTTLKYRIESLKPALSTKSTQYWLAPLFSTTTSYILDGFFPREHTI